MKTKILLKKLGPPIVVVASLLLGTGQNQVQSAPPGPVPVTQAWVARYNGLANDYDAAFAIAVDASGNVYVTGSSGILNLVATDTDYATIKYDSAGQQLWIARYNGPGIGRDRAAAIAVDSSGNVYVTGQSSGSGTGFDYATVKYDPAGQEQWVARYNGPGNGEDDAVALAVDSSGNVYVTGRSRGSGTGYDDYATIKYNSAGQEAWVARYNGPGNGQDEARAMAIDSSGNVYVTGRSLGAERATGTCSDNGAQCTSADKSQCSNPATAVCIVNDFDYATVKYDSADGHEVWVARYNGPANLHDDAYAIAVDSSGNVYVTGESVGASGYFDYATVKYDSATGKELWVARYNGPANLNDDAYAIAVDSSGNVYVTGESGETVHGRLGISYATIKYNSAGQEQWVARYGGTRNPSNRAEAIALDGSGNVYVTGWSAGSLYDYATIKYDSAGQQQWVARYNGPRRSDDHAHAIALDSSGNVYVTGESGNSVTGDDYATIKYVQNPP